MITIEDKIIIMYNYDDIKCRKIIYILIYFMIYSYLICFKIYVYWIHIEMKYIKKDITMKYAGTYSNEIEY